MSLRFLYFSNSAIDCCKEVWGFTKHVKYMWAISWANSCHLCVQSGRFKICIGNKEEKVKVLKDDSLYFCENIAHLQEIRTLSMGNFPYMYIASCCACVCMCVWYVCKILLCAATIIVRFEVHNHIYFQISIRSSSFNKAFYYLRVGYY